MFDGLAEYLNTGDPVVREWFLIKSNFWPISLCTVYLLTIRLGQTIMRDRKPFELRKTMITYNLFLVATYTTSLLIFLYCMWLTDKTLFCKQSAVTRENYTYTMARIGWVVYLLKYLEFLDTIFFILRKKDKQITSFHVIHHTILPFCGWIIFRTERSGFPTFVVLLNSIVHIAMYSYYGLAAMGPNIKKYLWWKRYLTIAEMMQYVVMIFLVTVILPLAGCTASKSTIYLNILFPTLLGTLFYNLYKQSFKHIKLPPTAKFRTH